MTELRSRAAILALVTAGIFPPVTVASPDYGTVGGRNSTRSSHMAPPTINRATEMPADNRYNGALREWLESRAQYTGPRTFSAMQGEMTGNLARGPAHLYHFGFPNAGFRIEALYQGSAGDTQIIFMLRQKVDSEEEFKKLQQTNDPNTRIPYISPRATWQDPGLYPVAAFAASRKNYGDQPLKRLNVYDWLDRPDQFTNRTALVELFGLKKDHYAGETRPDIRQDFLDVRSRGGGPSNIFEGLLGGGQQRQPQQQQYPGQQQGQYPQQRPTNCDGPGALDGAVGSNGRGGVQINLGKIISNVAKPKPPGCE
jgi:hypothetical protein